MRKFVWFVIVAILLASCGVETHKTSEMTNSMHGIETKQANTVIKNGVVFLESDIDAIPFFRDGKVELINDTHYLITVNGGGVHGPDSYEYYFLDIEGSFIHFRHPDINSHDTFSGIKHIGNRFFFDFTSDGVMEVDLDKGTSVLANSSAIPSKAVAVTAYNLEFLKDNDRHNLPRVDEAEIVKRTGLKSTPLSTDNGSGTEKSITAIGIVYDNFILVERTNYEGWSDGQRQWCDYLGIFDKSSWKKYWEIKDSFESFFVVGSLVAIEGKGFFNPISGSQVSMYANIKQIATCDGKLFMFAEKDGKPKFVVLNLDRIDELKN